MRLFAARVFAVVCSAPLCLAQLTPEQKLFDFQHLASIYAKNYAPYEWKRDLLGVDLYRVEPWIDRVRASRDDLEYLEIASEFVASLQDSHSTFAMQSNFRANIAISTDIYDGKVLIESIGRATLPESQYPFQVGDEILSIDGRSVDELIAGFSRFVTMANPRGTRRVAASLLFSRAQTDIPRAHEIGDEAVVVVRRESGDIETYSIPWVKRGAPLTKLSPGPGPFFDLAASRAAAPMDTSDAETPEEVPAYRRLLQAFQTRKAIAPGRLAGWGQRTPVYSPPEGFVLRLGRSSGDFHLSGTYPAGGKRIGLLRIPNFQPPNPALAARELRTEIAYLQQNTDGLVVDITRNTGGGCYGEDALRLLIPYPFRAISDEIRATQSFIVDFELSLESAKAFGAEANEIALLESFLNALRQAQGEQRGRTGSIPLCGISGDLEPEPGAYTKPVVLLTDEFTVSWGDVFAAVFADARRGKVFGYRTDGAGGVVIGTNAGFYSDSFASFSATLGTRQTEVKADGYPSTAYLENVGVHPDIPYDVMTRDNLMGRGRPFTDAFTAAILAEIGKGN